MIRPVARVTRFDRNRYEDLTERAARAKARAELNRIGQDMVDTVTNIVQNDYERREGDRHKGGLHLDESFEYRLFEGPGRGFPMRVELTTKPEADAKKVAALNFGAKKRYVIKPRSPKKTLAWEDPAGEWNLSREVVRFPENSAKAGRFMQRARDAAMRRFRARQK